MLQRRELLKNASLIALAPVAPAFFARAPRAKDGRILVVIEVNGGNDGLNTLVPYGDDAYAKARPTLAIPRKDVLTLDDRVGFHPSLKGFAGLLEAGQLAVVQGAGYPSPNLSHEVAMATWHTGRTDYHGRRGLGWLGRGLDAPEVRANPAAVLSGQDELPGALASRRAPVAVVQGIDEYLDAQPGDEEVGQALEASISGSEPAVTTRIRQVLLDARATSKRLRESAAAPAAGAMVPTTQLGRDLALIAFLIRSGLETPVYYAVQHGYDTHAIQADAHAARLAELGGALEAFCADIRAAGALERVLVLLFSEFGRRVGENASRGTDHGTAAPVFLAGPAVKAGLHGTAPSLTELDDGNLVSTVDFRSIYATVMRRWLGWDTAAVLETEFAELDLLRV